jgi:hypothetical protein
MEIELVTTKLKVRIIKYLQEQYRRSGVNASVSWRGIWIELGVPEEDFSKALRAATDAPGGQAQIVIVDSDHIKLDPRWTEHISRLILVFLLLQKHGLGVC